MNNIDLKQDEVNAKQDTLESLVARLEAAKSAFDQAMKDCEVSLEKCRKSLLALNCDVLDKDFAPSVVKDENSERERQPTGGQFEDEVLQDRLIMDALG